MTTNLTLKQELERCERWLEDKTIEYDKVKKELEELKNNKIIIDKEDTERYLNVFEREVLKQIVKEIEDNKKLLKVGAKHV